ncbi:MAG: tetratricopeptide repeat protein [Isosphaeraceae bacterium]
MPDESSGPNAGRRSVPAKAEEFAGTINISEPGDAAVDIEPPVALGPDDAGTVCLSNDVESWGASLPSGGLKAVDPPAMTVAATLRIEPCGRESADPSAMSRSTDATLSAGDPGGVVSDPAGTVALDPGATIHLAETHAATVVQAAGAAGTLPLTQADPCLTVAEGGPAKGPDGRARCGRYVLKKFFARGGMGEVWLAEDPAIGRPVALKRMLGSSPEQQMRFRVEAQITGQLEHPGIVPIHELGTNDAGEPFYAMKFVQGRTLKAVIEEFHARGLTGGAHDLELHRLLQMFLSLCQAVAYSHSRGVIHRDLKPDNVMLGSYGETILLDWGIAKVLGRDEIRSGGGSAGSPRVGDTIPDTGTYDGAIMGTPAYMAPEVAAGLNNEVDERSDIYLLGAILFEVLSGQQPRTAKTMIELLTKARDEPVASVRTHIPHVPKALDAICLKAMAHRKEDRYATAGDLADDVQRFVAGEPVSAYRENFPERAWRWARRHRTAIVRSVAALGLAGITLLGVQKFREAERLRVEASRAAEELRTREQARHDLARFHRLADEANFYAATTEPVSENAPYYDPSRGEAAAQAALAVAAKWGPGLERLALPDARAKVKQELYGLLLLDAVLRERGEQGSAGAKEVLSAVDRAEQFSAPTLGAFQLRARAYERVGDERRAAEFLAKAADPNVVTSALDDFLQAERLRTGSAARVGDPSDRKPWQPDPATMEQAIALYRQALAIDPDHYWSRLQLGRCYQSLGRFAESVEALGACVAIRPEAEWGYSALGLALAQQGRLAEAEIELNKAIQRNPDSRPPRLHRGVVSWRQKKHDAALADFQAVLEPPDDRRLIEAYYYRGQLYLQLGEHDKALSDFNRLAEASPRFRSVYLDRPMVYLARGDVTATLADLDAYIKLARKVDPDGWEIHGLRGRILRFIHAQIPLGQRSGPAGRAALNLAVSELMKAVQKGGRASGVFDDLGAMMEHAGRLPDAVRAYSAGLAAAPRDVKLLIKRGWALELAKQHALAQADFAAAAAADPENAEAHSGLGYVRAVQKLLPDAQREAELALLHGGESYLVLHNVACIYAALSQNAENQGSAYQDVAMALLRSAVKLWKRSGTGPNELDLMRGEPAFEPMRGRKDFQDLLRDAATS